MDADVPELQRRLDALVAEGPIPGAQLSVLHDGEITSVASGVLNRRTGQPATVDSLFQIGSITKTWTATVAMQLVDEGVLSLDEPVLTRLPEVQLADPATMDGLTLRHLLCHTSGIDGDVFTDTGSNDDCLQRYVALLRGLPSSHALGETWSYCNAGYGIAGRLIEVVCDAPFEQVVRDRLAGPLGLERFAFSAAEAILHGAAVGHVTAPDGHSVVVTPTFMLPRNAGPAGLISTTMTDLLTYARMHLDDGRTRAGDQILSPGSARAMRERQVECPSSYADAWGIGWMLFDWDGGPIVGHGGQTLGQCAELLMVPHRDMAIALALNGPRGHADHALLSALLHDLAWVEVPPLPQPGAHRPAADAARLTGTYERFETSISVEADDDGRLCSTTAWEGSLADLYRRPDDGGTPLLPTDDPREFLARHPLAHDVWAPVRFYGGEADDPPRFLHAGGRLHRRT